MKLVPISTEKSLKDAKEGRYSFWVSPSWTKTDIKNIIGLSFGVKVKAVKTINYKGSVKKNMYGKKVTVKPRKKTIVTLAQKQTIDIFEEKKSK